MDLQHLAEISREYLLLYDHYRDLRRKVHYREVGEVLAPWPNRHWTSITGEVYYSPKEGELFWEFEDNVYYRNEDDEGRITSLWLQDDGSYSGLGLCAKTEMYMGDWCALPKPKQYALDENLYREKINALNSVTALEAHLNSTTLYSRILRTLQKHKVRIERGFSFPGEMARDGDKRNQSGEARDFELAVLRIISGGLLVYCDPISFALPGHEVGATRTVKPSKRAQKAAVDLLNELDSHTLDSAGFFTNQLRLIAGGNRTPGHPLQLETDPALSRRALVREVALLGKRLLAIKTSKADRFPEAAIQGILEIIGGDAADITLDSLRNYQKDYDNIEAEPLTDHRFFLLGGRLDQDSAPF